MSYYINLYYQYFVCSLFFSIIFQTQLKAQNTLYLFCFEDITIVEKDGWSDNQAHTSSFYVFQDTVYQESLFLKFLKKREKKTFQYIKKIKRKPQKFCFVEAFVDANCLYFKKQAKLGKKFDFRLLTLEEFRMLNFYSQYRKMELNSYKDLSNFAKKKTRQEWIVYKQ